MQLVLRMLHSETELKNELKAVLEDLSDYLKQVRTGRANAAMFETLQVKAYGAQVELRSVANVIVENATSVVIQPYDKNLSKDIAEAITNSNLSLNAVDEGGRVRINIPPMTEEKRKQTVDQMKVDIENRYKKSIRQIRHTFMQDVEKLEGVSEDEVAMSKKAIQAEVDRAMGEIDSKFTQKEEELMAI